jgi:hypothetical protein
MISSTAARTLAKGATSKALGNPITVQKAIAAASLISYCYCSEPKKNLEFLRARHKALWLRRGE